MRNTERWRSGILFAAIGGGFTIAGFFLSLRCGILTGVACAALLGIHWWTEYAYYRQLKTLSEGLDRLLHSGTPLPVAAYSEGELAILADEIQKLTLRLSETIDALTAEKRALAQSLADISHQLRTPMTAMSLTVTMLSERELPEARRVALAHELRGELLRMDWLVETLLKLSRLDAGMVTLACTRVAVSEVVRRAIQPLAIPMELHGQTFTASCSGFAVCDLAWTAEAVGNLLKNAMEHTPSGGTIAVSSQETPLYTELCVQDTGEGFDREDLPHLFERFYRGKNASQSSAGIGLAFSRAVITQQNGTIEAKNTQSGACFVVRFYKQVI